MIVYLVTEGEYSDYGVVAVFSTRAKAQAFEADCKAHRRGFHFNIIDEWLVDVAKGERGSDTGYVSGDRFA